MKKLINYIIRNKKTIASYIKVFLLFFAMLQGIFLTYLEIWIAFGLPLTIWAVVLQYVLACVSGYGYYRWIRSDDE